MVEVLKKEIKGKVNANSKEPKNVKVKILNWFKKKSSKEYDYSRCKGYALKIFIGLIISIFFVILFCKKADVFNQVNLWKINLAGVLLIISIIVLIKFSWDFLKEIVRWVKGQRRWIKILICVVIILLLWQAFTNNNFIVNPLKDSIKKGDFSKLSPLDLEWIKNSKNNVKEELGPINLSETRDSLSGVI